VPPARGATIRTSIGCHRGPQPDLSPDVFAVTTCSMSTLAGPGDPFSARRGRVVDRRGIPLTEMDRHPQEGTRRWDRCSRHRRPPVRAPRISLRGASGSRATSRARRSNRSWGATSHHGPLRDRADDAEHGRGPDRVLHGANVQHRAVATAAPAATAAVGLGRGRVVRERRTSVVSAVPRVARHAQPGRCSWSSEARPGATGPDPSPGSPTVRLARYPARCGGGRCLARVVLRHVSGQLNLVGRRARTTCV
jgi:hypothetical protein